MALDILSFSHVCIGVSDIERSLDFYRRVLGFDVVFDVELEGASLEEVTGGAGSKGRMVGGLVGGVMIELLSFGPGGARPAVTDGTPLGYTNMSVSVTSLDAAFTEVEAMGFRPQPPVEIAGVRMFFVADPDGTAIEVIEYPDGKKTSLELAVNDVDLTDLDNFADGFPHHLFNRHRREAPVYWHEPTEHTPDGEGFWSVATYAEVLDVLKDPLTFSSETGGDRPYGGTLLQDLPVAGIVLNMMDDPRHVWIRRLVSKGLTPRTVAHLEDELRVRARRLLAAVPEGEPFDFLVDVAAELPMQMICILLGVPEEDRHALFECVEPGFDFRKGDGRRENPQGFMLEYGRRLIAEKRADPGDDMLSVVVHATLPDVDPPSLTDDELYMFFSLLFSAGAETTRNAIAGGIVALLDEPDQLRDLRADRSLVGTTVEEALRWTTPSPSKRRTATRATTIAGHDIAPGDKVLIWEGSANRDDLVFEQADRFDAHRDPNPHVGFGHGLHFCLGANLARLEIRVMFEELLDAFPTIERAGPVEWTRSNRHTGIRHLPLLCSRA